MKIGEYFFAMKTVTNLLTIFILIIVFCFCSEDNDQNDFKSSTFAIYDGKGWSDGVTAFVEFLKWKKISYQKISPSYINNTKLLDNFKAIYFPGGDADDYVAELTKGGIDNIRNFVNSGGGYIGICAGAEFASDVLIWNGVSIEYPLKLFHGQAIGPYDEIARYPVYDMTMVTLNSENIINKNEPAERSVLYFGGTSFHPYDNSSINIIATYNELNNLPAAINFNYGNGKVVLIGPHPEIDEESDRDNSSEISGLTDGADGSDWPWLSSVIDWILN